MDAAADWSEGECELTDEVREWLSKGLALSMIDDGWGAYAGVRSI